MFRHARWRGFPEAVELCVRALGGATLHEEWGEKIRFNKRKPWGKNDWAVPEGPAAAASSS